MGRSIRIEFCGALYHVTARGVRRGAVQLALSGLLPGDHHWHLLHNGYGIGVLHPT
jgi:hypothetical protein